MPLPLFDLNTAAVQHYPTWQFTMVNRFDPGSYNMNETIGHPTGQTDPRYKARIAIYNGPYQKELLKNYSVNLSAGGLFIETLKILPVDTELLLKFKLPDVDTVISCNARVAWTNDPDALKKISLPPGMGLQFINISLDDLHFIRAFLDKGDFVPTW